MCVRACSQEKSVFYINVWEIGIRSWLIADISKTSLINEWPEAQRSPRQFVGVATTHITLHFKNFFFFTSKMSKKCFQCCSRFFELYKFSTTFVWEIAFDSRKVSSSLNYFVKQVHEVAIGTSRLCTKMLTTPVSRGRSMRKMQDEGKWTQARARDWIVHDVWCRA